MYFPLPTTPYHHRDFYRLAAFCLTLLIGLPALAQSGADVGNPAGSSADAFSTASDSTASKTISSDELASLVAPIALYPDALVAQILMASTYPLEVVEAARWIKANPELESDALEDAMQKQSWDPSVKSLTAFPQVLAMMNEKLTWANQLGQAFLSDQKSVMNSLQSLRQKAKAEGNLETNSQQTVTVKDQPTGSLCPHLQPNSGLRHLGIPHVPALLLVPAKLCLHAVDRLFRCRAHSGGRNVGQLQLA